MCLQAKTAEKDGEQLETEKDLKSIAQPDQKVGAAPEDSEFVTACKSADVAKLVELKQKLTSEKSGEGSKFAADAVQQLVRLRHEKGKCYLRWYQAAANCMLCLW